MRRGWRREKGKMKKLKNDLRAAKENKRFFPSSLLLFFFSFVFPLLTPSLSSRYQNSNPIAKPHSLTDQSKVLTSSRFERESVSRDFLKDQKMARNEKLGIGDWMRYSFRLPLGVLDVLLVAKRSTPAASSWNIHILDAISRVAASGAFTGPLDHFLHLARAMV